jgi:hypothetical protein
MDDVVTQQQVLIMMMMMLVLVLVLVLPLLQHHIRAWLLVRPAVGRSERPRAAEAAEGRGPAGRPAARRCTAVAGCWGPAPSASSYSRYSCMVRNPPPNPRL